MYSRGKSCFVLYVTLHVEKPVLYMGKYDFETAVRKCSFNSMARPLRCGVLSDVTVRS